MKKISNISLITLTLLLVGCNEEVSPELKKSNNTFPGTEIPKEYYFSVTNSSRAQLGYKIHKTGAGNASTPCEVRSSNALSNDNFRGSTNSNDITCYFEAEELALWHGGFKFKINSSKNTCDYISYRPFGFYNRMPGDSSASYIKINCGSNTTGTAHVKKLTLPYNAATNPIGQNLNLTNPDGDVKCGEYLVKDNLIDTLTRKPFIVEKDDDLCRFNYKDTRNPMNCDIGVITIDEYNVVHTPTALPPDDLTATKTTKTIRCGGKIQTCVAGPIRNDPKADKATDFITHYETELDKDFSVEKDYPSIIEEAPLLKYSNFRRDLASLNIDFESSDFDPANSANASYQTYVAAWGEPTFSKIFDPSVMEFYSQNEKLDGTKLITNPEIVAAAKKDHLGNLGDNRIYAQPYAAEPYLGLYGWEVSPYYVAYCLDKAYDIKARIRMVVREWDRTFPSNSEELEYLSDLFKGQYAIQDNYGVELLNNLDGVTEFNDILSWDERILMTRSQAAPSDPYVWEPTAGWFNYYIFPNYSKNE